MTVPPSICVLKFSDAFESFWSDLAIDLQATLDSRPARAATVVDVEKELQAVKDTVLMSFSLLPEDALVGLITCGTTVNLYDLAADPALDQKMTEEGVTISRALPPELHTIAKCGHWTMIEKGPLFRRLVADHCMA